MAEKKKQSHLGAYVDALVQHAAAQIKPIDRPTGETIGDSIGEPNVETNGQSVNSPIGQTIGESLDQPSAEPVIRINETQFILLNCIRSLNGGLTSLARISAATGIPADTLKSALRRLRENGAITHYCRGNCNGLHGFSARTNERRRINLIGAPREQVIRKLRSIDFHGMRIDEGTPIHLLDQRFDDRFTRLMPVPHAESSSSNFNTKLLTEVEDALETHPDLGFWREQGGLQAATVVDWVHEFSHIPIPLEDMILYLSMCAHDMVVHNKAASIRRGVADYFYGCLRRHGCYFRPAGYTTIEERSLAERRYTLEERERVLQDARELGERERQAEIEQKFQEMMSDEKGELYRECIERIPALCRDSRGPAYRAAMRTAFIKITGS